MVGLEWVILQEDGRFLVSASKYDSLLETYTEKQLAQFKLVRVYPKFRVIALGLPVRQGPERG